MKRLGSAVMISLLALVGCENSSPLDKTLDKTMKNPEPRAEKAGAAPGNVDHSGALEDRVARLEENAAKSAEALEWLTKWYAQQQQQQKVQAEQREREDPDPDAVFAVDIAPDLKLGQIEGPSGAAVTIVEAWDFA